jgi:hypothetical protein
MKQPQLSYFKVTSLGEVSYTWAPSRQSILEDMQRMGIASDCTVEEADPGDKSAIALAQGPAQGPAQAPAPVADVKIMTLPGGQKIKIENGEHYTLEWKEVSVQDLIDLLGCIDIRLPKFKEDLPIEIFDWIKLEEDEKTPDPEPEIETDPEPEPEPEPEPKVKEEDVSKTDINV